MGGVLRGRGDARLGPIELRLSVIGTLLEPALRLACVLKLPLEDVETLARSGYVRVAKERGLSVRAMARGFKCSPATITAIVARGRDRRLGAILGLDVDRKRKLVALGGESDFDHAAAMRALHEPEEPVLQAIEELVEARILSREPDGRYRLQTGVVNYVDAADASARLSGLRQLLEGVTALVHQRFFAHAPGSAFVRALSFASRPTDFEGVRDDTYKVLEARVREADRIAEKGADGRASVAAFFVSEMSGDAVWTAKTASRRGRRSTR